VQWITKPTFHTAKQHHSLLDLILTEDLPRINDIKHLGPLQQGTHGHDVIKFHYTVSKDQDRNTNVIRPNYYKGNYKEISDILETLFAEDDFFQPNIDVTEMCEVFNSWYQYLCDEYIPRKSCNARRKYPQWFSSTLIRLINNKRRMWRKLCRRRSDNLLKIYKSTASAVKTQLVYCRKQYELHIALQSKTNPKLLYQYLNRRRTIPVNITTLQLDGETVIDPKEIANIFNKTYALSFSDQLLEIPPFPPRTTILCPIPTIDVDDIAYRLRQLNPYKSVGSDGIHPYVLKHCSVAIAPYLEMIFNASISQGQVPNQWKSVYVKPIYKCGSKTEASNYRPITLNSITCKVLESIVQNTIMTHLSNNNLIHPSQHGFRKNHTTVTNLLD
jgi:hypothetical protein